MALLLEYPPNPAFLPHAPKLVHAVSSLGLLYQITKQASLL